MKITDKIQREFYRFLQQFKDLLTYKEFNPFPRTRRANKPSVLRLKPSLEIDTLLEFIASTVMARYDDFVFMQIGAYDGYYHDVLPVLARKYGWSGILVEPQPIAFQKLVENFRSERLHFENAAIAKRAGELPFYTTTKADSNLASFNRLHLLRHGIAPPSILEIKVPVLTIHDVLDRHNLKHLNLLQIDAEGSDGDIIRSIDFSRLRPDIIRYEHRNMVQEERSQVILLLANKGYKFVLEDNDTIAYFHAD